MMDLYTRDCIDGLKSKMYSKSSFDGSFDEFDMFYPFTNEYISDYLNYVSCDNKNYALSVMSSGDHAFNLIVNGIVNIDTFDINKITEYYALGLKRAMILKYSYSEFKDIFDTLGFQINIGHFKEKSIEDDMIQQLVLDLEGYMDKKHRDFWLNLINDKDSSRYISSKLMYPIGLGYLRRNNYLKDEATYNLLKSRLGQANISFVKSDVLDIGKFFDKDKYDVIILSNILDYMSNSFGDKWDYNCLSEFTKSLETLCRDDAIIFLHYLMSWRYDSAMHHFGPVFLGSGVHIKDLKDYRAITINGFLPSQDEGIILRKVFKKQ